MALKRAHSEIEDENAFKSLEHEDIGIEDKLNSLVPNCDWQVVEKKQKLSKNQQRKLNKKLRLQEEHEEKRDYSSGTNEKARQDDASTIRSLKQRQKCRTASITFASHTRLNGWVKIRDVQSLILYVLADEHSPHWVAVNGRSEIDRVVVLQVPGLDADLFNGNTCLAKVESAQPVVDTEQVDAPRSEEMPKKESPDDYYPINLQTTTSHASLKPLSDIFEHRWPIRASGEDKSQFLWSSSRSMLSSVIPKTKESKKKQHATHVDASHWENKPAPISSFLASAEDLANCEYVIHPAMLAAGPVRQALIERRSEQGLSVDDGWVDSLVDEFDVASIEGSNEDGAEAGWQVLGIDCEMCKTSDTVFELTRISIVDWDNRVILDELVKPPRPITDYLTQYSGITKEKLDPVSTTLQDIQRKLLEIVTKRTIIVGHSLNSDFNALKFTHPYIIDTSIIFPHPRGPPLRSALKYLTQKYLNREIQAKTGSSGHDSIEDARAVLDLVKQKCQKGIAWGMSGMSDEPIYQRLRRNSRKNVQTDDGVVNLTTAHVHYADYQNNYGTYADLKITCVSDDEIVAGISKALASPHDTNFVWAELRQLEETRGWRHSELRFPGSRNDIGKAIHKVPETREPSAEELNKAVVDTVSRISEIYKSLPEGAVFMVYSGAADRREWLRLQHHHQTFKREYSTKKWDELSVRWTDIEEQALRKAYREARDGGLAFVTVKSQPQDFVQDEP